MNTFLVIVLILIMLFLWEISANIKVLVDGIDELIKLLNRK